jgi:hypothetical protein
LTISTRWRWPTARSDDRPGLDRQSEPFADLGHLAVDRPADRSATAGRESPSTTFSATVKRSTSRKCWCTMPMPWLSPSRGLRSSAAAVAVRT